jgi:hypothetical protein
MRYVENIILTNRVIRKLYQDTLKFIKGFNLAKFLMFF